MHQLFAKVLKRSILKKKAETKPIFPGFHCDIAASLAETASLCLHWSAALSASLITFRVSPGDTATTSINHSFKDRTRTLTMTVLARGGQNVTFISVCFFFVCFNSDASF